MPPLLISAGKLEDVGVASTTETIVDVTGPLLPPVITATLVTVCCEAPPVEVSGAEVLDVVVAVTVPLLLDEEDVMVTGITIVPLRFGTSLALPLVSSVVVALNELVTLAPSPPVVSVELHIMEPTETVFVDRRLGVSLVKGRPPIPVRLSLRKG